MSEAPSVFTFIRVPLSMLRVKRRLTLARDRWKLQLDGGGVRRQPLPPREGCSQWLLRTCRYGAV